jgi:hypothetical protein
MGWGDKLKGLLGGKPTPPSRKAAPSKTYNAPTNRAAILAEAMAIHGRERAKAQGVLERALKEMKAKPPKPSDIAGMTRLLELRQAVLAMNRVADHDQQRQKVLGGVKSLMESGKKPAKGDALAKSRVGAVPSQGTKR